MENCNAKIKQEPFFMSNEELALWNKRNRNGNLSGMFVSVTDPTEHLKFNKLMFITWTNLNILQLKAFGKGISILNMAEKHWQ